MPDSRDRFHAKTPPAGVRAQVAGAVEFASEELTGRITDPGELAKERAKRPTDERLGRLETKYDTIASDIGELKSSVAEIKGTMTVMPELVGLLKTSLENSGKAQHLKLTAEVDIEKARATDQIDAAKESRKRWSDMWTKILAGAGIAAAAVLAAIQARGC